MSAWSITGFTVLVAGIAVTASLTPFVVGILAWIAVVYVVRWVTLVDRALAGWQRRGRVSAAYRGPVARGFIPFVRALTSDPQTWRDLAWLAMNSALGFAGGVVVLTTGSLALSYLSVPLTYRALSLDVRLGPSEATHPVDTISGALILFAIGVILVPVALGLARAFATFHAGLATKLLGLRPSGSHE